MTVFSSLNPDKYRNPGNDRTRCPSLQAYLRFACNPEDSSLMRTVNGDGESVGGYDSPFEKQRRRQPNDSRMGDCPLKSDASGIGSIWVSSILPYPAVSSPALSATVPHTTAVHNARERDGLATAPFGGSRLDYSSGLVNRLVARSRIGT